jgi:Holliday junction DNA helicase RuvA
MISHVTGMLKEVTEETVVIERGGLGITVAIPKYVFGELAAKRNREVTLHTLLFIEGNQGGGHMEPHLVGFVNADDKRFFKRFISVKNIGWRKALKALAEPVGQIARYIETADIAALKRLPGIGPRAAEVIVAELKGKVADLALSISGEPGVVIADWSHAQQDAISVMVALGDPRGDAERWLEKAAAEVKDAATAEDWVRAAYRVKSGVAV